MNCQWQFAMYAIADYEADYKAVTRMTVLVICLNLSFKQGFLFQAKRYKNVQSGYRLLTTTSI